MFVNKLSKSIKLFTHNALVMVHKHISSLDRYDFPPPQTAVRNYYGTCNK